MNCRLVNYLYASARATSEPADFVRLFRSVIPSRGARISVAHTVLQIMQSSAAVQGDGGKYVPQAVRTDLTLYAGLACEPLNSAEGFRICSRVSPWMS